MLQRGEAVKCSDMTLGTLLSERVTGTWIS